MAARALAFVPALGNCGQLNLPSGSRYIDVGGFVCPSNLFRYDQLCSPETMAVYTVTIQDTSSSTPGLVYTAVYPTNLTACVQHYITELDSLIANVAANLTNVCQTLTGLTNIYIELKQSTTSANVSGRQLIVPPTLRILPSSVQKVNVLDCIAAIDSHIRYLESGGGDRFMAARALAFVPANGSCGQLNLPSNSRYTPVGGFICPSNLVRNDNVCLPCPIGTYRDGAACTPCSPGQYQDEQAQTQCKNCPEGFTSLYAGSNRLEQCIEYCSEGMISDTGLAPCTMCPADTYFSNRTHCAPCPAGTTTNGVEGTENSTGCKTIACTMVNEISNKTYTCGADEALTVPSLAACWEKCVNSQCSAITFYSSSGSCIIFYDLSGRTYTASSQVAVTFTKSCRNVSAECRPGYFSYNGREPCTACPRNFYQNSTGQTTCSQCSTDSITTQEASDSKDHCTSQSSLCSRNDICQNGGTCTVLVHVEQCLCPDGYTGQYCEDTINPCDSNPCFYNGTCMPLGGLQFRCDCYSDFSGQFCERETNHCLSNDCQNGGMCQDLVGGFKCLCPSNSIYSGPKCTDSTPVCDQPANACQNGGTCQPIFENIRSVCNCVAGFTGRNCETNIDDCEANPCLNGGCCTDGVNTRKCNCTHGYTGVNCETRLDMCAGITCAGKGTCVDDYTTGRVKCLCEPGYTSVPDDTCRQINLCNAEPCVRGACTPGENTFICTCPPGYNGARCQHNFDECASDPCLNGGTCIDGINGYTCTCATGFTGIKCTSKVDFCEKNTCDTTGTLRCVDMVDNYRCHCKPGYTGVNCFTDIDECASNPCFHQGTCAQGVNSFNCTCPPGWEGDRCERMTDICTNTTCGREGTCINLFNDFFCNCTAPFYGRTCNESPDVCAIANPCINGGTCAVWNNSTRCHCPLGYYGDGCQLKRDYCLPNPCRHQGTCTVVGLNYTCACVPGYDGRNCEDKIHCITIVIS
ncbi:fibropellin-1 [Lingula anatina]|uniref:Fibropellin-1 n=1 Tax=Lingula anatina TaxID=7574 RepID=A0A1S3J6C4_LINAN|nr:fibropellin-1 [Lingula anatina]|eukprot:XP_013405801.1 fibropellin-1 [Lingula anatina]